MWDKKRLLSERSEFQPFPHICPTDQRTPAGGFRPGRMGARQALAREVTKRERAKQTNYDKKRSKLSANGVRPYEFTHFWGKKEHFSDVEIQ
jgi:hypothetical protein